MKSKPNKTHHIWKILAALFLLLCIVSVSDTANTFASSLRITSATDAVRQHMLDIAYLYANHRWQATATNIIHPDGVNSNADAYAYRQDNDPRYRYLLEQDHITVKYINNGGTLLRDAMFPLVDTPHGILAGVENEGIPYAWGGRIPMDIHSLF